MRTWKIPTAAFGLGLSLAASAHAGLIATNPWDHGTFGHWIVPAGDGAHYWAYHRPAHPGHGLDLRALLGQYPQRPHAPFGPAHSICDLDAVYPLPVGLSQALPADTTQGDADDEDSEEDESGTEVASQDPADRPPVPPIPAVPEPGSMAMVGAGALGLLAARALLKGRA